ncbi:DUF3298 and DUF4163 domain-containing protein [Salibacter halophilus]|uniref:DUF3298 and DUF4163 domain-containing protein n=1 Tax=Salibacter halophilus TaxID=1803916 RepID=A0A6N6MA73_9FLAO|nr:DUF3298 and DUF4163 domain-containing protein [Salibacter halophilus]KAB1066142.1 DUF3298 and DUF4163 domain-containing protein [Salibacter halophilus]
MKFSFIGQIQFRFLIILGLFLTSCGNQSEKSSAEKSDSTIKKPTIQHKLIERTVDNCNTQSDTCTYASVKYPVFSGSDRDKELNKFIFDSILNVNDTSELRSSLDSFLIQWRKTYEMMDEAMPWVKESAFMASFEDSLLHIEQSHYLYSGGAHGNYGEFHSYFSWPELRHLSWKNFIDESENELIAKLKTNHAKAMKSKSYNDLIDKGYIFDDSLYVHNNFVIGKDSISFLYNPYEIAPYSEGIVKIKAERTNK